MFISYCPECGRTLERESDKYSCKGCGTLPKEIKEELIAASESRECENCGAKIGVKDKYCYACGKKVSK